MTTHEISNNFFIRAFSPAEAIIPFGDMLPPLKSPILKWGFLFNSSSEPGFTSYPRVPRGFSARLRAYSILSGYGLIFLMHTACAALLPGY